MQNNDRFQNENTSSGNYHRNYYYTFHRPHHEMCNNSSEGNIIIDK